MVVSPFHGLTDMEIEALRNAISGELLNYQGWIADDYGSVKMKSSGVNIYKTGYVTAISKILTAELIEKYCYIIKEMV